MYCDYQTLFIILVGTASSQYLVLQFIKNQICLKNLDYTLQTVWKRYYKDYSCQNYDLWKQNNTESMKKRLQNEQQRVIMMLYMWNIMWIILLCFCLPRIWALPMLSVMTTYGMIVLFVSYIVAYIMTPKMENKPDTYIPYYHI